MKRGIVRHIVVILGFTAVWLVANYLARLTVNPPRIPSLYPGGGLALAFLLIFGLRYIPALLLGPCIGSYLWFSMPNSHSIPFDLGYGLGYALVYGVVAWLLVKRFRGPLTLRNLQEEVWLTFGAFLSAILYTGSVFGLVFLRNLGTSRMGNYFTFAFQVWSGEAAGLLVLTPFILLYLGPVLRPFGAYANQDYGRIPWPGRNPMCEVLAQCTLSLFLYALAYVGSQYNLVLFSLSFLPLLWIAARHGTGTASITLILSSILLSFFRGFLGGQTVQSSTDFRVLLIAFSATTFLLAAFVNELHRTQDRLLQRERDSLEAERRFRELLESVNLAGLILDSTGRILFCNDYLLRLSGRQHDEVDGRDWFETFIPAEDRDSMKSQFLSSLSRGYCPSYIENFILTDQGEKRSIQWNQTLLRTAEGQVSGVAGLGIDVTAHRGIEEQYRQAQKLESIGRLAGGVAHDFNNLLTVINGYSQLVLSSLAIPQKMRCSVEQILKAGERASDLTRQLLAFSRKQVLQPKVLNLNGVVQEAGKMLQRVIGEPIELVYNLEPSLGNILADPGQMHQVIMNLAVNARDAMPKGGRLILETRNVVWDSMILQDYPETSSGRYVMLTVRDNGQGIEEALLERIFEPFFTTKQLGEGTGLGLSTVYGIVKQSGGHIRVDSQPDRGTAFKILFRQVDSSATENGMQRETKAGDGTEIVLVVEDQQEVRELTAEALRSLGYTVLESADGQQAEAISRSVGGPIHLLLTDVILSKTTGPQLAKQLIAMRPEIKVLYMSGYAGTGLLDEDGQESTTAYLQKPFSIERLATKVREVLDSTPPSGA